MTSIGIIESDYRSLLFWIVSTLSFMLFSFVKYLALDGCATPDPVLLRCPTADDLPKVGSII